MKQDIKILCVVNLAILLLLVTQVLDLITLLNDNALGADSILKREVTKGKSTADLPAHAGGAHENALDHALNVNQNIDASHTVKHGAAVSPGTDRIPKIIHQTYKSEEVPAVWRESQQSIKDLHPDYKYILWTDEMARDLIAKHYAWFLPTFDGYRYPIMRADAMRYFVLFHYGGIYIDLDNGTKERLDPLLNFSAWLRKTHPTGISNDIMGSSPGHPFFKKAIDSLQKYDRNWIVPYITVMYSTGPLFLSVVLKQYKRVFFGLGDSPDRGTSLWMRVLSTNGKTTGSEPLALATDYFFTVEGSSWHKGDAQYISIMCANWVLFFILFFALGVAALLLTFYIELVLIHFIASVMKTSYGWLRKNTSSVIEEKYINRTFVGNDPEKALMLSLE